MRSVLRAALLTAAIALIGTASVPALAATTDAARAIVSAVRRPSSSQYTARTCSFSAAFSR